MEFTSSTHYFLSILHFLERQGIPPKHALEQVDLVGFDLNDNEQRIALKQYSDLLAFAEQELAHPLIGFELGKDIKSADFGLLGYLIESATTLADAVDVLLKYDQLVANIGQASFSQQHKLARISWQPFEPCSRQVVLRNFTAWLASTRQILGRELSPTRVCFQDSWSSAEQQCLVNWFGCPVLVNCDSNSVEFPTAYLKLRFQSANPSLFTSLAELSKQQLAQITALNDNQDTKQGISQTFSSQVTSLLAELPNLTDCSITTVAQQFAISTRQLQRKLKAEETSYAELFDRERKTRAEALLNQFIGQKPIENKLFKNNQADNQQTANNIQPIDKQNMSKLSIGDIAAECGFNEQSSFNKAFHRWFSCSPSQYIKSQAIRSENKN
ncbi:AraC family transcriptional regulator ligand-binding domain-containing protein [Thalassotalea montiporae]